MKAFLSALMVGLVMLSDVAAFDDSQSAQALIYIGVPLGRTADNPAYSFGVRIDRDRPVNENRYANPVAREPAPIMDLHSDPDFEYTLEINGPQHIKEGDPSGMDEYTIIERLADRPTP